MRKLQIPSPRPELTQDITRLWIGPGFLRIGAVFGNGIPDNWAGVCWDTAKGRALWEADLQDEVDCFPDPDFDRELTRVVHNVSATDRDEEGRDCNYLILRDITTGAETRLTTMHAYHSVFTPDGRHVLATATNERPVRRELRRWPAESRSVSNRRAPAPQEVRPDSTWAIRLPQPPGSLVAQMRFIPTALSVSADGRFAALGRYDGSVLVWNLSTRRLAGETTAAKGTRYARSPAHRLRFAPDGSRLAVIRRQRLKLAYGLGVSVWSVPGGKPEKGPKEQVTVNDAVFSPDGRTLLTAREDGTVGVWETTTWKLLREYAWKIGKVYCIAFSPDGLLCAAGGEKGRVVVWDVDA